MLLLDVEVVLLLWRGRTASFWSARRIEVMGRLGRGAR